MIQGRSSLNGRNFLIAACLLSVSILPAGAAVAADDEMVFSFEVVQTRELSGFFSVAPGEEISVEWGDGTVETFSGARQEYAKDYGEPVSLQAKIYAPNESSMVRFQMHESGAVIRFDLNKLPAGLEHLRVAGSNTIEGDISELPAGLKTLDIRGSNTLEGDIGTLPEGLSHFFVYGNNTLTGDISRMPPGLTRFYLYGMNTANGDIGRLPSGLEYFRCHGENTLAGDIAELPDGLAIFDARGSNTVSGDIAKLPRSITIFAVNGDNTVTGDVAGLPAGLTSLDVRGQNRVTGDVSDLPPGLTYLFAGGFNTISGDIAKLPEKVTSVYIYGSNRISGYTAGREWSDGLNEIRLRPSAGFGFSSEEVDNLLIDLARAEWSRLRRLEISSGGALRSPASDGAVAALENKLVRLLLD